MGDLSSAAFTSPLVEVVFDWTSLSLSKQMEGYFSAL